MPKAPHTCRPATLKLTPRRHVLSAAHVLEGTRDAWTSTVCVDCKCIDVQVLLSIVVIVVFVVVVNVVVVFVIIVVIVARVAASVSATALCI